MAFTSLAGEDALLQDLADLPRVFVDVLGTSVQGRPLRLLRIGDPPPGVNDRVPLLVTGTQHGNEFGGREGVLQFAQYLATTGDPATVVYLAEHGVLLMPTCNPDGVAIGERNNANGVDVNRDHIALTQPEPEAIATVLTRHRPAIVLDLHEGNVAPDLTQLATSAADGTDEQITRAAECAHGAIAAYLAGAGWATGVWSGQPTETILRNTAGLRNSVGMLAENRAGLSDADRAQVAEDCCHAALYHVRTATDLADMQDSVDAAQTSAGAAGVEPLQLRVATVDPPPLGYRLLTAPDPDRMALWGLAHADGVVSLGQWQRPAIGYLFDSDAPEHVQPAERLFDLSVPESIDPAFTFDETDRGFDDGRFDLPDPAFIFDHDTRGQFDLGLL